MRTIAFYGVADYERPAIEAAAFPEARTRLFEAQLTPELAGRSADAEVLSVFIYSPVTEQVLERMPRLRMVSTRSTGYDHIDLAACRRHGIVVTNVPSYGENTVAEHAFSLLFALAKRLGPALERTRALDFSLAGLEGFDLRGKVLGVVGAGRIGTFSIRLGKGVGMQVLAYDPHGDPAVAEQEGFHLVSFAELLARSDVITIHAALVKATHHLFDRSAFERMKPGAVLVNTARGAIVDSEALYRALETGRLAGAGLDVLEGEELIKDLPAALRSPLTAPQLRQLAFCVALARRPDVVMTPHSAFFTQEGVARLIATSLDNIRGFLAGTPQNLVEPRA